MNAVLAFLTSGLLASSALQVAVAGPSEPNQTEISGERAAAPAPPVTKADAIQQSSSVDCTGPDIGDGVCEFNFKKFPGKKFALVDNVSCLLDANNVRLKLAQIYVIAGGAIKTVQNLKMQETTGAASAGTTEFFFTSNDKITLYALGGENLRVHADVMFLGNQPKGKFSCHISGAFQ